MTLAPFRVQESAQSLALASTPKPFGKPGGPGLWKHKGLQLPAYIQQVAHGILKSNASVGESGAIQRAVGVIKRWASGEGKVDAGTQAAASKAIAEWEKEKASHGSVKEASTWEVLEAERWLRDQALVELAVVEHTIGQPGIIALLSPELREAAAWSPKLKRIASAPEELERHEVQDGGQHVGTISKRSGFGSDGPRWKASAINGTRLGDYNMKSQQAAVDAVHKHLQEAPARVGKHANGKWLVANPGYSGQMSYQEFPDEGSARFAAGLPAGQCTPEKDSKVAAMAESVELNLQILSGVDIAPLRRVQQSRRALA